MPRTVMEQIKGVKIPRFTLNQVEKVADLIFFDGPLLSWFKNENDQDFLFYWVDSDEQHNRWLVFRTSNEHIENYIRRKETLLYTLTNPVDGFLYSVDIVTHNNQLLYENTHIIIPSMLPDSYLPDLGSYYEYDPSFVRREIDVKSNNYVIQIDREWSLDDLHSLPQTYSQVYSFAYNLEANKEGRPISTREKEAFARYPWRGGFSTVHFYNDLQSLIPAEHKPIVARLQYSSPGIIELKLYSPISTSIRNSIQAYLGSAGALDEMYQYIMKFQKEQGFSRKQIDEDQITPEAMEIIMQQTDELAQLLKYEYTKATNDLTNNRLLTLRIILSYFRRIKILAKYQIEGRAIY
jgi:hypothetical protein